MAKPWPILICALLLTAAPAAAAEPLPAGTDRLLWCASAFFWLSGDADDSGEPEEAALYQGWSDELLVRARAELSGLGYGEAQIEETVARYDEFVLEDLTAAAPQQDVALCQELVEAE